jgi:hypothetical protein
MDRLNDDLPPTEQVRFQAIVEEYFYAHLLQDVKIRSGAYAWSRTQMQFAWVFETPGGRSWWRQRKHVFGERAVAQIEALFPGVRDSDSAPGPRHDPPDIQSD